jgi:hypothetical protein
MRTIAPVLRVVLRAAVTALVLAPVAWVCALFFFDLHARPSGRVAVAGVEVQLPLEKGRTVTIPLTADSIPYRGVAVRFEAATPARVTLRLCGAVTCNDRAMEAGNGDLAVLPVPAEAVAGGTLSLTATLISGGPVAIRGDPATPAVEVIQGHSWRLPARRAREVFRAMAGTDVFLFVLGTCAVALTAALGACLVLAFRTAAPDEPT